MGLIYVSGESNSLISALKANINSGKATSEQLKSGSQQIISAVDGQALAGAAYTAAKGLFSELIIPTVGRVTSAIEDLETELQLYISAHDMVSGEGKLDEDKLNQQINTKKAMKLAVDRAIEVTKSLAKSNSAVNVLDSLLNVQFRLGSMSNEYAENIKELEEKLEKLHQFSSSTSGLFNESLTAMKIAMQSVIVLNKTLVKSDGSYVLPVGIDRSWFTETREVSNTEFEKLKKKIADDDLPATKAEILRDYYWSTNSNQYVSRKTGKPSVEVTALYNKLVMAEHQPQKNPELEFYNEMLRTGKHPITGEDISDAERVNAKIMMYGLALQPFVGAWAISQVPKSYETGAERKVSGAKPPKTDFGAENPVTGQDWNNYFKEKYGAGNVQWKPNSFDDIISSPRRLYGSTKNEIKLILGEGWTEATYGSSGNGWKFTNEGDGMVFFHPGDGIHGGSYYGFSTGDTGKVKIVGEGYIDFSNDKATIIEWDGE
ncbi:hypothetical protein I6N95_03725 [Vagococcus sp. BWB3-3]|uniref:LXG domain-containing protein n=1 Tax=Vagococcus allomyrinae TaxID=2794353 RepID=A0A940P284_9ENTE|nr:T7SS effector LXG polymorphic toxin [Vagococcus allomyrinae]MBP1040114.1 hypothetical protein [Vagococcus allomyrinae]